jgi:hypothetical protein
VPARLQGWRAPAWLIIGSQYAGLVVMTALIALVVTW